MYNETAKYYDIIYRFKDFESEAAQIKEIIKKHFGNITPSLLDVGCGTGSHLQYLKAISNAEGLDYSEEMIDVARQKNPDITFHCQDMADFNLAKSYHVITCLFGSIGYVQTLSRLTKTLNTFATHLTPQGLLLLEPWFQPDEWKPNTVHGIFIDEPHLKIARVNTSFVSGSISHFDLHYLIGTPQGTDHICETHELGLFTHETIMRLLSEAGCSVEFDKHGLSGRGLFKCVKTKEIF
ncbi:class I SAM-dependent methyltransferase [bacterium]|nr:class I SAM-dependent methyltransferase [candidate division CSSED10-310 bacterium]